ncbi:hypothetical protein [Brachybacterium sp. YJGR34]|uniref:hypothetical protein n=1 Tax=Brachybacterium sp. YJGR34 TaxID=2059911 RepID=UPI001300373F|nr:hypothetical protein [Brachybacterium sp. YJGR34]
MKSHVLNWLALLFGVMSGLLLIELGRAVGYTVPLLMSGCLFASLVLGLAADHFKETNR